MFRRPKKRRNYTLEERLQKFAEKASPCKIPTQYMTAARRQGLSREPLPDTSSCNRLLTFILENATYGKDGYWYYIGPMTLAAAVAQVDRKQSYRCVCRFIKNGLLERYGDTPRGKPQQYRIHLKTKE